MLKHHKWKKTRKGFSRHLYLFVSLIVILIAVNFANRAAADVHELSGENGSGTVVTDAITGSFPNIEGPMVPVREETRSLEFGESPASFLRTFGFTGAETVDAVEALSSVLDVTRIRDGQEVTVEFGTNGRPREIRLPVRFDRLVSVHREYGRWIAEDNLLDFETRTVLKHTRVESSLYAAAKNAGIPLSIMMEAIGLFGFQVDFQRDIHQGNGVTLLYETLVDENEEIVAAGELIYARLDLNHRSEEAWRHENLDGSVDYYEPDGTSVRKALLKTPVDGGRITSGFGYRKHPILGFTALHRGVDFAVPIGTPVMSAGDGRIIRSGWHDQYGNHVLIRHANHYDTLYAHFSSIASGMVVGKVVTQGTVVGYVGSTGMSTGPHCHYEVRYYGSPVNPAELKFPPKHELTPEDERLFELERAALLSEYPLTGESGD